ncbi:MAG: hypothetical protein KAQ98_03010 [Bacteriovoracaceae bacterium]|nr:hypothetical protein [Bacteriovoracaceae bacterium]
MKKIRLLIIAIAIVVSSSLFARAIVKEGHFIHDANKQYLKMFYANPDLTIDLVSSDGYEVYGPDGLGQWLDQIKVNYTKLEQGNEKNIKSGYPSPEKINEELQRIVNKYSHIMKIVKIGKSVNGRDLVFVKISDNPEIDEVEPEFKYIGNMHGDEITNRDVLVKFIEWLGESYATNTQVGELIDNTEIWIMPSMNPDGAARRRRGNAKWIDLNRDFPDFTTNDNENTVQGRAIETQAVMNFQKERRFALSANFHGGAVVVNYPWDTTSARPPLHELITEISSEYANLVDEMVNSSRFPGGIVNGYDWYTINGGMQDWSFYWHGDLQTTIEMHGIKWPSYSAVEKFYEDHRESLLKYIRRVHHGAGLKLSEPVSGNVKIFKIDAGLKKNEKEDIGRFSFNKGEFFKVLESGNYEFMISTKNRGNYHVELSVEPNSIFPNGNYKYIELK